ncbi:histone deacetylase HST2 Ecym_7309 [Eremothecium cymbalariae DBVPG|uniref:NAD-dependent protein deacetylase n=1 Tax=Eremothecium cymbalariae (strain CBS 270.75 / DBVPG 7215 / KCTC 17166 / NRRL Y-17582) TaxID=931890 RepID=G8JWD1_ERECY|nr:hypothetical protein Ecym_7309 [Eremothecium cymbalariae DBVPG\
MSGKKEYQDIGRIVKYLNDHPKCKVMFMVGAGISTSCGIPDFRTPGVGLYDNVSKFNLPFAEAIFEINFFRENQKPFYTLAKGLYPGNFKPSLFHYFMRLFHMKGRLKRVYTQNIDTLESATGIEDEYIIEAHGSFRKNHCIDCNKEFPMELFKKVLEEDKGYAKCPSCKGLIKPKIVFFGEGLPDEFYDSWDKDKEALQSEDQCLVFVAGTSLMVYPFAALPEDVPEHLPRALINMDPVGDFLNNPRETDIILEGTADEFAEKIARDLGWFDELMRISGKQDSKQKTTSVKTSKNQSNKTPTESVIDEGGLCSTKEDKELFAITEKVRNLDLDKENKKDEQQ